MQAKPEIKKIAKTLAPIEGDAIKEIRKDEIETKKSETKIRLHLVALSLAIILSIGLTFVPASLIVHLAPGLTLIPSIAQEIADRIFRL